MMISLIISFINDGFLHSKQKHHKLYSTLIPCTLTSSQEAEEIEENVQDINENILNDRTLDLVNAFFQNLMLLKRLDNELKSKITSTVRKLKQLEVC